MQTLILTQGEHKEALGHAEEIIRRGGIVVMPTDTVYGLLCDACNEGAVRSMFAMKQRPDEKVFPIFVKDVAMARQYAYISDAKAGFLEKVWPGPVTAVFQHKEKLPAFLTGGKDTIGIRMPDNEFILELFARLGSPLAQTSANISGEPAAKNAEEVKKYFASTSRGPDLLIDGGQTPGTSSTVVDCTGVSPLILRTGPVSKADLDRMLKDA